MIDNHEQLKVTLDALAGFYRALADLNRERDRHHPSWHAVLAEGPLEYIRRLEAEINAYIGRTEAEAATADLCLRIEGEGVVWPDGPSSILSREIESTRRVFQGIMEYKYSGRIGKKPTQRVAAASDFRVRSFAHGSLQVSLEFPSSGDDLLVQEAMAAIRDVASWMAHDSPESELESRVEDFELRAVALAGLVELAPGERSRVRLVELSGRALEGQRIRLDVWAQGRARTALNNAMHEERAAETGVVREADLDAGTFTLRKLTGGGELPCRFPPEVAQEVARVMNHRVRVWGIVRTTVSGRKLKRMQVEGIELVEPFRG